MRAALACLVTMVVVTDARADCVSVKVSSAPLSVEVVYLGTVSGPAGTPASFYWCGWARVVMGPTDGKGPPVKPGDPGTVTYRALVPKGGTSKVGYFEKYVSK